MLCFISRVIEDAADHMAHCYQLLFFFKLCATIGICFFFFNMIGMVACLVSIVASVSEAQVAFHAQEIIFCI